MHKQQKNIIAHNSKSQECITYCETSNDKLFSNIQCILINFKLYKHEAKYYFYNNWLE